MPVLRQKIGTGLIITKNHENKRKIHGLGTLEGKRLQI
jgi:hypothetical protein